MSGPILVGDILDEFMRRMFVDCLLEQTSAYWLRRAETFEWARPHVGDFTGSADDERLKAQDDRLREIAQACRNAASLCRFDDTREAYEAIFAGVLAEGA